MQLRISEKFKPLWTGNTRYYILTGGRGSSKSFTVNTFLSQLLFEANNKVLFTRYTLTAASKSIIPEFAEKIEIQGFEEHYQVNQNNVTNTATGSEILFSGIKTSSGNQTASLKSLQGVNVWVLDEAEELDDESIFDKIDLSVRSKKAQNRVILILNPATKEHWIYKRFFEQMGVEGGFNGTKGDVTYIHTTYKDNIENLSESYLNNIRLIQQNNPAKYEHQILGGWRNKSEGVIFENWERGKFDESLPYFYGLDFGFVGDPDACAKVAIDDKRQKLYIEEVFYERGQKIETLAKKIDALPNKTIVADSAESRLINYLTNNCGKSIRPVKKGAGSINSGIELMRNYEIVVCGDSLNLVKELNNYSWNGKAKEAPIDLYNHLMDAIRYVVWTYANRKDPIQPEIENNYTKFIKGDTTGYNAAHW